MLLRAVFSSTAVRNRRNTSDSWLQFQKAGQFYYGAFIIREIWSHSQQTSKHECYVKDDGNYLGLPAVSCCWEEVEWYMNGRINLGLCRWFLTSFTSTRADSPTYAIVISSEEVFSINSVKNLMVIQPCVLTFCLFGVVHTCVFGKFSANNRWKR